MDVGRISLVVEEWRRGNILAVEESMWEEIDPVVEECMWEEIDPVVEECMCEEIVL
jgi:hypothetical protein